MVVDPSSLAVFKGVMVSLVTLLCSHWGQSRLKMASNSPKELDASCHIVELCRKVDGSILHILPPLAVFMYSMCICLCM